MTEVFDADDLDTTILLVAEAVDNLGCGLHSAIPAWVLSAAPSR